MQHQPVEAAQCFLRGGAVPTAVQLLLREGEGGGGGSSARLELLRAGIGLASAYNVDVDAEVLRRAREEEVALLGGWRRMPSVVTWSFPAQTFSVTV